MSDERPVLLIDEIDKADIEFPNDLLLELDRMEFFVYETGETVKARRRPIVVITSNNEKELPDAFLRRCFFHYIRFPDPDTMRAIIEVHFPGIKQRLVAEALKLFYEVRDVPGLKKKPSTSELLDWLKLLMVEDIGPETLARARSEEADPAAARRAAEERAGRAPVRAAGVHGAARGALARSRLSTASRAIVSTAGRDRGRTTAGRHARRRADHAFEPLACVEIPIIAPAWPPGRRGRRPTPARTARTARQVSSPSAMPRAMISPAIAVVLSPCPPNPLASQTPGDNSPICGMRCTVLPSVPVQAYSAFDIAELRIGAPRCRGEQRLHDAAADRRARSCSAPDHIRRSPPTMR